MVPLEWTPVQTANSKGYKKYVKAIIACVILILTYIKKTWMFINEMTTTQKIKGNMYSKTWF